MSMKRTAWLLVAAGAFVMATPARAPACLWDYDTLRMEALAFPGIAEVLTGRFERNPPRYYEMRLGRVAKELETSPDRLEYYDDAGVACDRLGRSDEAIEWMGRKRSALDRMKAERGDAPELKDHEYRYHANLGTFYAHRWFKGGASRENLDDLRRAEAEIARAIEINPDAHFGREKYQLAAIRWAIELLPKEDAYQPTMLDQFSKPGADELEIDNDEAIRGLSGLIVLGNAWESVDVTWALGAVAGANGDASIHFLAKLRLKELIGAGRSSLHPEFTDSPFMSLRGEGIAGQPWSHIQSDVESYFARARKAADQWHERRWTFMEARFNAGLHPDTHPEFWNGWKDRPRAPSLPNTLAFLNSMNITIVGAVLASPVVLFVGIRRWRRRVRAQRIAQAMG